ncbi:MAG: SDR family NAD(P)-dependent oxidoreductase [Rhodospirillales bacterium]|nr:SDR family NAD(P)-dependent oxidoreductase [Rhodospirillales bacterium]
MELKNKTILITGGTSGIGLELVRLLWERGNEMIVIGRSQHKLDDLKDQFVGINSYQCDLSQRQQIEEVMDAVIARHPDISVLINNAAVQFTPTFISEDFDHDSIGYEITTNLTAPLWMTSLLLASALLQQSQALIVNVSSGLAFFPKKESAVYCATKAALHSISQSLRYQLAETQVGVTEVILPLVDTPMTQGRGSRKMTAEQVARGIISGIEADRKEIYLGIARLLPLMQRLAPGITKNLLKRH